MTSTSSPHYRERLSVPIRWWLLGSLLVLSLWVSLVVAVPGAVPWAVTAAAALLLVAALLGYGGARVEVAEGWFRAGRARIEGAHLGDAVPLDAEQTRRMAGVEADARAYLLLRAYVKRAVQVEVTDPLDPVPYWLVSTRRPEQLAEALAALRESQPSG